MVGGTHLVVDCLKCYDTVPLPRSPLGALWQLWPYAGALRLWGALLLAWMWATAGWSRAGVFSRTQRGTAAYPGEKFAPYHAIESRCVSGKYLPAGARPRSGLGPHQGQPLSRMHVLLLLTSCYVRTPWAGSSFCCTATEIS